MSYARVAVYNIESSSYEEILGKVREGLVPIMKQRSGLESYNTVDGGGQILSFSVWDTQENAQGATDAAGEWVRENLAEQLSVAESFVGEVTPLA